MDSTPQTGLLSVPFLRDLCGVTKAMKSDRSSASLRVQRTGAGVEPCGCRCVAQRRAGG